MRSTDRSGLAVMVSVILASFTARPLTRDLSFLGVSWVLVLLIGIVTMALRRARLGAGAVFGTQLVLLAGFVATVAGGMSGEGESWYAHIISVWADGAEHMQSQAAPMAPNDGVKLIFVTVIGVVMVVTDLVVSGVGRAVWAIGPPATLFLVPAIGLGTDTGVVSFLCIALGYLAILVAEGLNSTARWTRGLSSDSAEGFGTATPVVWRAATYIGVPALVLTAILGAAVPTLSLPGFGFGNGPGGRGPLQLSGPTLDLRRNLNQPVDRTVITYSTNRPGGVYLRLASLPRLSSAGFGNVQMSLDRGSQLGQIPGISSEPTERRTTNISVGDFGAEYLPLPYAPRSFTASGEWASDANSLVVVANGRGNRIDSIRDLQYTVQSVDIAPDGADLSTALAGTPADAAVTGAIPSDLPDSLVALALEVTADADTPALKAAAIQAYLRSPRFTYSTDPQPGSGYQALENFLLRDREGYCEQFAAAMATMARAVNIPSRVAVGFLPGERDGDTWQVSIRDMHAWPELYFSGYGWVRFEPTPASVTGAPPAWTVENQGDSSDDPTADPSSAETDAAPSLEPSAPTAPTEAPTSTDGSTAFPWGRTLVGTGAGLLALLVLAAPATIRIRRRTSRLSDDAPAEERVESAWAEIRDSVLDYGGAWPLGSPRSIGHEIGGRLESEQSDTMTQVATIVERSRYARTFTDTDLLAELPEMTEEIRRGLAEPRSFWRRASAILLPRSLFRRPPKP
jgi:transglutaminase-like putative cysteine protease